MTHRSLRRHPVSDRERFAELVHRLDAAKLEGIVRPLFGRFIEIAREQGRVAFQIATTVERHDAYRAELAELAGRLGLDDPFAGDPLPSTGVADRVFKAIRDAGVAASEEYRKCRQM